MEKIVVESPSNKKKVKYIKDEDGYYKVLLSRLNVANRAGIFYRVRNINAFFGINSLIGKRIENRNLINQLEHPETKNLTYEELREVTFFLDFAERVSHTKKIEIINTGKISKELNLPIYEIYGWVIPSGPNKEKVEDLFENGCANVPYSIRSVCTEERRGGLVIRDFLMVSTWDLVSDGGISGTGKVAGNESAEDAMIVLKNDKEIENFVAGFEANVTKCEDGACALETMKKTLKNEHLIYSW